MNKSDPQFRILERDKQKADHWLCEEHLVKQRKTSSFVNCLIYVLGIQHTDELLSVFGTSVSGLIFGLQPHFPELFADEKVLHSFVDRLTYNYGIDADIFRGKPLAYDCELEETVVGKTKIKRATQIKKALTLELIFKSHSGATKNNGTRS